MTEENMTPEASTEEAVRRPSGLKRFFLTIALLFGIWATFAYAVPYFLGINPPTRHTPNATSMNTQLAAKDERIASLETRLAQMENALSSVQNTPAAAPESTQNAERIAALEGLLRTQQEMIAEMKANGIGDNTRLAAIVVFNQLKKVMLRGDSFRKEYEQLASLIHHQPSVAALNTLAPYVDTGTPTLATLKTSFDKTIEQMAFKHGDWRDTVHSLIRIRKTGSTHTGDDAQAIIARAEAKLIRGAVAAALQETQKLSEPTEAMLGWQEDAKAYLASHAALDELYVYLLMPPPSESAITPAVDPSSANDAIPDSPPIDEIEELHDEAL